MQREEGADGACRLAASIVECQVYLHRSAERMDQLANDILMLAKMLLNAKQHDRLKRACYA